MTERPRIICAALPTAAAFAAAAAVPALMARPAASARTVLPVAAAGTTIYACLTSRHTLTRVSVGPRPACPAGTAPVPWHGQAGQPVPAPNPRPTPPAPSPTRPEATRHPT